MHSLDPTQFRRKTLHDDQHPRASRESVGEQAHPPALADPRSAGSDRVADTRAQLRSLEFFDANIRNPHTRRASARATGEFFGWCEARGVSSLAAVRPLDVAARIEALGREVSVPTVKQRLAGVRLLFDWLVVGQIVPVNPAAFVRGPSYASGAANTGARSAGGTAAA